MAQTPKPAKAAAAPVAAKRALRKAHVAGRAAGVRIVKAAPTQNYQYVIVGDVNVLVRVPTPTEVGQRVKESKAVVRGIGRALAKRGVKLAFKPTTPVFTSDPKQPNLVQRKIGNVVTRGEFKNGVFVKVA